MEWRDLDAAGHVNNAAYVDYVEQCGLDWAQARGLQLDLATATRSHRISYRQPAVPDDELLVSTWAAAQHEGTLVRDTTLHRASDGSLVARARTEHASSTLM